MNNMCPLFFLHPPLNKKSGSIPSHADIIVYFSLAYCHIDTTSMTKFVRPGLYIASVVILLNGLQFFGLPVNYLREGGMLEVILKLKLAKTTA